MITGYPRTCRSGHVLGGPEVEHIGEHRQCRECRWNTQRAAQERYRYSPKGEMTGRRTLIRERELANVRDALILEAMIVEIEARVWLAGKNATRRLRDARGQGGTTWE